ncbi:mobile element-associated protein [Staphylococcus aureus]|nr:mobile element-associated protein [Staphylococcus aureus]
MNWEIKDLMCDIEAVKEKINDVAINHGWHFEELYPHEPNHNLNKDELIREGASYHERRIHNNQMFDLFHLYIEQFDNIIEKFYEIEKASSENFGEESDDAKNSIKVAE